MKKSAIVARVAAPIAAAVIGSTVLLSILLADLSLSRPGSAVSIFLYSVVFAILSGAYARWDIIAARIFAIGCSVVFFGPLAWLLVETIHYSWPKIYAHHLVLMCCYIAVGLASPFMSLASVRIVQMQFPGSGSQLPTGKPG